jgi:hypothetical protein
VATHKLTLTDDVAAAKQALTAGTAP